MSTDADSSELNLYDSSENDSEEDEDSVSEEDSEEESSEQLSENDSEEDSISEKNKDIPPPIPESLKVKETVKLEIKKPSVILQLTTKENIKKIEGAQKETITLQTIDRDKISLDDLLVKRDEETDEMFLMRSAYAKVASQIFKKQINNATAILIGETAANEAIYGITYPKETYRVIRYVNSKINEI